MNVILLIITQAIYSVSDLIKKEYAEKIGMHFGLFKSVPFVLSLVLTGVALGIQVYVLSRYELSKTMITLGVLNILFATTLGAWVLKEKLSFTNMLGVVCAVAAVILLNVKK